VVALLAAQRANATSTLVFPGPSGDLLRRDTLGRWFRALVAEAGVRPIRLHDLRHTAATILLLQGVPVHVVAAVLGHSNPSVTLAVYAHLIPGSTRDALELLARYLDAM
jgi:integrase